VQQKAHRRKPTFPKSIPGTDAAERATLASTFYPSTTAHGIFISVGGAFARDGVR
jgi:hypothetical protein